MLNKETFKSVGIKAAMNPDAVLAVGFALYALFTGSVVAAAALTLVAFASYYMTELFNKEMVQTEMNWGKPVVRKHKMFPIKIRSYSSV